MGGGGVMSRVMGREEEKSVIKAGGQVKVKSVRVWLGTFRDP